MFLKKLKNILSGLSLQNSKALVAFSGGADSTALTFALHKLKDDLGLALVCCHVNHGLRGNGADADEDFCGDFCKTLGIEFCCVKLEMTDTGASSYEAEARKRRYEALRSSAGRMGCRNIVTAHTMNDQAETFLMRLMRGSGMRGLSSIHERVDGDIGIIRPLLGFRREDILSFINENSLRFREDPSNSDMRFLRSRVRKEALPALSEVFGISPVERLSNTVNILADEDRYLEREAAKCLNGVSDVRDDRLEVDLEEFRRLDICIRRRIIRLGVERVKGDLQELGAEHVSAVLDISEESSGSASLNLPGGTTVLREYGRLIFSLSSPRGGGSYCYEFTVPGFVAVEECGSGFEFRVYARDNISLEEVKSLSDNRTRILVDADKAGTRITVRNSREGDRFTPLGCGGTKKVRKLFIDRKLTRHERDKAPVILAGSEILWVCGSGPGDRFRIDSGTSRILDIERKPLC